MRIHEMLMPIHTPFLAPRERRCQENAQTGGKAEKQSGPSMCPFIVRLHPAPASLIACRDTVHTCRWADRGPSYKTILSSAYYEGGLHLSSCTMN